jgi:hypothetical protein
MTWIPRLPGAAWVMRRSYFFSFDRFNLTALKLGKRIIEEVRSMQILDTSSTRRREE